MPLSGLGSTPGGGPTGRPEAIVLRALLFRSNAIDLLGAGVDDVELPVAHQDALRALQAVHHGLGPAPVSLTTRPAPDSATSTVPSGSNATPDRVVQARREHLDIAGLGSTAPGRCPVRRTTISVPSGAMATP